MARIGAVGTGSTQSRVDRRTPQEALDGFAALLASLAARCTQEHGTTPRDEAAPGGGEETDCDAD